MTEFTCPNCGHELELSFKDARMTTCAACKTSLFLDGAQFQAAGTQGVMHAAAVLMDMGETISVEQLPYNVVGHARFDYGPGWWDEFWAISPSGQGAWISVDEGEVILQRALAADHRPRITTAPKLGETVRSGGRSYNVVEADQAVCIAVAGDLPEVLRVGETYAFVNCVDEQGNLLSGEFADGEADWYIGTWIDPFDVVKLP